MIRRESIRTCRTACALSGAPSSVAVDVRRNELRVVLAGSLVPPPTESLSATARLPVDTPIPVVSPWSRPQSGPRRPPSASETSKRTPTIVPAARSGCSTANLLLDHDHRFTIGSLPATNPYVERS